MNGNRIIYFVCVDDVKHVLQDEYGIVFDSLSEAQQEEVIDRASDGLGELDWYQYIDSSLKDIKDTLKKVKNVKFQVVVRGAGKENVVVSTFDTIDEAMQAQTLLKIHNGIESKIVKKISKAVKE